MASGKLDLAAPRADTAGHDFGAQENGTGRDHGVPMLNIAFDLNELASSIATHNARLVDTPRRADEDNVSLADALNGGAWDRDRSA